MDKVDLMSDAELRTRLLKHGYSVPITASNRNFLKKKLKLLTNNNSVTLSYRVENVEPIVEPVAPRRRIERKTLDFKSEFQVDVMPDTELRARLLEYGYNVPVTDSNRSLLKKKLKNLSYDSPSEWRTEQKTEYSTPLIQVKPMHLVRNSTDFITASQVPSLTNAQLRARLNQYGYRNMPVTAQTRTVLENKLMSLLNNQPVHREPVNESPINCMGYSRYSSSSDNDDVCRTTSAQDSNSTLRRAEDIVSQRLIFYHPTSNICLPSDRTNTTDTPSDFSDKSTYTISSIHQNVKGDGMKNQSIKEGGMKDQSIKEDGMEDQCIKEESKKDQSIKEESKKDQSIKEGSKKDQSIEDDMKDQSIKDGTLRTTFNPKFESPFIIDFMKRLSALIEEPPRAISCDIERKQYFLTPLQQRVLGISVQ
ncbi:uncharacterized protein [Epargyreus clarus]|uniref:uncharacterized protein n=1 Tax=Epargyreus clarus TaxID=520877 RepID=UPI003C2C5F8C